MSRDYNQIILVGRTGNDPEVFKTEGKSPFAKVSIATNKQWKKDNIVHKRTDWHTVIFNSKLFGVVEKYLLKGTLVLIEGELLTQKWQDQDGKVRFSTYVQARELRFLSTKPVDNSKLNQEPEMELEPAEADEMESKDVPF